MKTLSATLSPALLMLACTLGATVAKAQTVDDIVGKAIAAQGGKDALNSVKTVQMLNTVEVNGNEAPDTVTIVKDLALKNVVDFNGQQLVSVFSEKGSWMINPFMGATTPTAIPEEQAKAGKIQYDVTGPLMDYAAKGNKVELQGKEAIKGQDAYKLKITTKSGVSLTMYVDAATGNVVRTVSQDTSPQGGDVTVNFSDYRKVDGGNGLTMAYAEEIVRDQFTINLTVKSVALNKTIDPSIFDMPK